MFHHFLQQTIPDRLEPLSLFQKISEAYLKDPETFFINIVIGVLGTIVAAFLTYLAVQAWEGAKEQFWKVVAWLGTIRGLHRLALSAYLQSVRQKFGILKNIYLDKEEPLDLHRVFVPLTLHYRSGAIREEDKIRRDTKTILTNPNEKRLVIIGDPGSGKSTLLKALASGVSRRQWAEFKDLVPVLVSLRSFSQRADKKPLFDWLAQDYLPEFNLKNGEFLLKRLLEQGRILLLLDGLDEVNEEHLEFLFDEIETFLTHQDKGCRVFVTCREQNYDLLSEYKVIFQRHDFVEYRLSDMRDSELEEMVRLRCEDFQKHGKDVQGFLNAVYEQSNITRLHRNPLLLTLSIALYLYRPERGKIPHNIAEFYEESILHLLRRHDFTGDPDREKRNRFDAKDKYALLQRFAFSSMVEATKSNRDFEEFPMSAMITEAENMARDRLGIKKEQAKELIEEIHKFAGLITDLGDSEHFVYSHRSFHEFCSARYLAYSEEKFKQLSSYLERKEWHQTAVLYCSIDHDYAGIIVERLLETISTIGHDPDVLTLAGQCASVLARLQVPLRIKVAEALKKGLEMKQPLFKSLLTLGRNAPEEVRDKVEEALKDFIAFEDPQALARELNRLEKDEALKLTEFMISSDDHSQHEAALVGLNQLEGIEKVPLLWQLLGLFVKQGHEKNANAARAQLLALMEQEEAVEKLNHLPTQFKDVVDDETTRSVYPFIPKEEELPNFARLLALEAQANKNRPLTGHWKDQPTDWKKFLHASVSQKTEKEAKFWKRLPRDRNRRIWSILWQTVGRMWFGLGLGCALVASVVMLQGSTDWNLSSDWLELLIISNVLIAFGLSVIWPLWRFVLRKLKAADLFGVTPLWITRWLEGVNWKGRWSSFRPSV